MSKITNLQEQIIKANIDVAYISDPMTIGYLTGFYEEPLERVMALLIFPDAQPFFFTPALEVEAAKGAGWSGDIYGYLDHEDPFAIIAEHVKERVANPAKWGIEESHLTVDRLLHLKGQFPGAKFTTNLTPTIERMRLIKSPDEIEKLNLAGKWADFMLEEGFKNLAIGRSEQEIAANLEYALKKHGIMHTSFDTLVQAGAHAAEPHGATSSNQVQNNELVLFDLGCMVDGYASDVSRTVAVGQLNTKQKDIYQVCLEAQLNAQDATRPGITAEELDAVARDVITKAGYGEYFIHRLGHGLGMSDHEFPSIMAGNKLVLQPGMCFSIEPGIYIPGVAGVRIEDCVHITANGCEPFTHTSKELKTFNL